jgi:hypothetical protein
VSIADESSTSITVIDNDDDTTLGVRVYVVLDQETPHFWYGHLEFVSPTNADGTCTVKNGGSTLLLSDNDDAAVRGYALTVLAAGAGYQADMPGTKEVLVSTETDNKYLRITNAAAAAPGVYFDEDDSNTYERIIAEVVDNANETVLAVSLSADASATDHTVELAPEANYEVPFGYQGKITGVWASDASGSARISEWS